MYTLINLQGKANNRVNKWASLRQNLSLRFPTKRDSKPVFSATETSLKAVISLIASLDTFQKVNDKGTDQSAYMCRLVCVCPFVIANPMKTGFLVSRPISQYDN